MGRQAKIQTRAHAAGCIYSMGTAHPGLREARTVGELLDRYAAEVVPAKAPKTQQSNIPAIKRLKAVFGHMPLETLKPKHIYQYLDKRGARVAAKREIEVLSHTYTKAIEWGLAEAHPIKGKVIRAGTPPRTRYVEDWEIVEALSVAGPVLRAYISIKLLTGLRRADLLGLRMADIREDGIHVAPRKTAKTTGKRLDYRMVTKLARGCGGRPCRSA